MKVKNRTERNSTHSVLFLNLETPSNTAWLRSNSIYVNQSSCLHSPHTGLCLLCRHTDGALAAAAPAAAAAALLNVLLTLRSLCKYGVTVATTGCIASSECLIQHV